MRLNIIHTNDLHGHLEHWPIIEEFIKRKKAAYQAEEQDYLILDDGDAMDSVHPLVEASQGQIMVDLFNQAGYHAATIGNNEGLNFTQEQLDQRYHTADFEIVISNLLNLQSLQTPDWAKPYIIKIIKGVKIGIFGVTSPYKTYCLNNYKIIDSIEAVEATLEQLKAESVDLIILLSHLGLPSDREIADKFPDIQLIVGGHTHHHLHNGERRNQSLLVAAGRYGDFIGEVHLDFDEDRQLKAISGRTFDIVSLAREYGMDPECDRYLAKGKKLLKNKLITNLPQNYLALEKFGKDSFIQMALEAICWATDCQLAMLNTGLFLSDLAIGQLNEGNLHEALPHPMHLATFTMKGQELYELIYEVEDQAEDLQYQQINGLGFRGKIFGEIVFKGIEYNYRDYQWYAQDEVIDPDKVYRIATVDHLWFLPFFPSIERYGQPKLIFPDFIRHVIAKYIRHIY